MASDWSRLPQDLLDSILDRMLPEFSDFVRFSSVCQSWRSAALRPLHSHSLRSQYQQNLHLLKTCRNQLPILMTPNDDHCHPENGNRSLYSVTEPGVIYDIRLPIPSSGRCFGTSNGWLFTTADHNSNIITLVNPFLNKSFQLPPFQISDCLPGQYYFHKALLLSTTTQTRSSVPDYQELTNIQDRWELELGKLDGFLRPYRSEDGNNYIVVIIYGDSLCWSRLGYLNSGDATWRDINVNARGGIMDIICYKGKVYGVDRDGTLVTFLGIRSTYPMCKTIVKRCYNVGSKPCLVESQEGDLLLVMQFCDDDTDQIEEIEVIKLSNSKQGCPSYWEPMIRKIGEQALFLCEYTSVSISTHDFPACKSNHVYFPNRCYDIGACYYRDSNHGEEIFGKDCSPDLSRSSTWIVPYLKT